MTVKTKYEVDQQVWFHYKANQYMKGKIESIQVNIPGQEPLYRIKNPLFQPELVRWSLTNCIESEPEFSRKEGQISATKSGVIELITKIYQDSIDSISEIKKKNWFGF